MRRSVPASLDVLVWIVLRVETCLLRQKTFWLPHTLTKKCLDMSNPNLECWLLISGDSFAYMVGEPEHLRFVWQISTCKNYTLFIFCQSLVTQKPLLQCSDLFEHYQKHSAIACFSICISLQKDKRISCSSNTNWSKWKKPRFPIQILARGPILSFKLLGLLTLQNIERFYRKFIVSSSQYVNASCCSYL